MHWKNESHGASSSSTTSARLSSSSSRPWATTRLNSRTPKIKLVPRIVTSRDAEKRAAFDRASLAHSSSRQCYLPKHAAVSCTDFFRNTLTSSKKTARLQPPSHSHWSTRPYSSRYGLITAASWQLLEATSTLCTTTLPSIITTSSPSYSH